MLAILYHLAFLLSDDFAITCQASDSAGIGGPVEEVNRDLERDSAALARAAAWTQKALTSGFIPVCNWYRHDGVCSLNASWAENLVASSAAKRAVRRKIICGIQHSRRNCSMHSFCEWAGDVSRCDVEAEQTIGDALLSTLFHIIPQNAEARGWTSAPYASACGFGATLRGWYGQCASIPSESHCPSHCKPAEARCLYRAGVCHLTSGCELNPTRFWQETCGSDVGSRCGIRLVSWSWAQTRSNESWQQAVECLDLACPLAANYWRRVFFLREHCASLNTTDQCRADDRCGIRRVLSKGNESSTSSTAVVCEPKPGEYAPKGCTFGEFADAAWECSQRNRSSCIRDCHFISGGSCWPQYDDRSKTRIEQCFSTPASKAPLPEKPRLSTCAMTSSHGLHVLAAVSKQPEMEMLARLSEHQAHCEKTKDEDTCNHIPVVYGELEMNVSDPEAFSKDHVAREAVAQAIAVMAGVAPSIVTVVLSVASTRRLITSGASSWAKRRASLALNIAGMVNADYTIYIPADQSVDTVLDSMQGIDNAAATTAVIRALKQAKLSRTYLVEVKHITASSDISKHHGPLASRATIGSQLSALLSVPCIMALLSMRLSSASF